MHLRSAADLLPHQESDTLVSARIADYERGTDLRCRQGRNEEKSDDALRIRHRQLHAEHRSHCDSNDNTWGQVDGILRTSYSSEVEFARRPKRTHHKRNDIRSGHLLVVVLGHSCHSVTMAEQIHSDEVEAPQTRICELVCREALSQNRIAMVSGRRAGQRTVKYLLSEEDSVQQQHRWQGWIDRFRARLFRRRYDIVEGDRAVRSHHLDLFAETHGLTMAEQVKRGGTVLQTVGATC